MCSTTAYYHFIFAVVITNFYYLKIMNRVLKIILALIVLFTTPFVLWNITNGFVAGFVMLLIMSGGLYFTFKKNKFKLVIYALLIGFISYILLLPLTFYKLNKNSDAYFAKIQSGKHLNVIEKWNIYGLNVTMTFVAFPFYPEAAIETFFMFFPDEDRIRVFHSDFFLKSDKLQKAFKVNDVAHFHWKLPDYNISSPEARVALALNPLDYEVKRYKNSIEYTMKVPGHFHKGEDVMYSNKYFKVAIREDLFWYLEGEGWLFPYTIVWKYVEYLD